MKFEIESVAAENLAILGASKLIGASKLDVSKMPHTGLIWFRHRKVLCAAVTSPTGLITVLYGVFKKFETLANDVTDEVAALVIGRMEGSRILQYCRAYVIVSFNPGAYAKLRLEETAGSGRAATQMRERIHPADGLFIDRSPPLGSPRRPWMNVGISHHVGGSSFFVDCDNEGEIIRELTDDEKDCVSTGVRTNDEVLALYSMGEMSRGVH